MPNHFHFILGNVDKEPDLELLMRKFGTSYVMYFNKKYRRVGHLFQNRYRMKPICSELYLVQLSRYIHQNPCKLISVKCSEAEKWRYMRNYRWSSYKAYCDIAKREVNNDERRIGTFEKHKPYIDENGVPISYWYVTRLFGLKNGTKLYSRFAETPIIKCEKSAIKDIILER